MATGLTLTTAGAAEIEAAYQAGEVVDITAVLIGDGGGVTLPTDPDDLAAVTALFGQFGRETFDSDSSYEGLSAVRLLSTAGIIRVKRSERRGWSVLRVRSLLTAYTRRHTSRRNLIPSSKRSF
jgi:hypothetical protein